MHSFTHLIETHVILDLILCKCKKREFKALKIDKIVDSDLFEHRHTHVICNDDETVSSLIKNIIVTIFLRPKTENVV